MAAFIASFMLVLLAEMGDKTQLLAIAFASRYSAGKVLLAVFLATIINHALAVLTGHYLTKVIPIDIISFLAALSFIIFGLWTIRGDKLEGEDKKISRFGPVITVGIAFFLAEMGDKTQLTTIALAVEYRNMISVLIGTTLAMVVADAGGIVIGIVMRKHIPERFVKWVSAIIFILFGFSGVYKILSAHIDLVHTFITIVFMALCTICGVYYVAKLNLRRAMRERIVFILVFILLSVRVCFASQWKPLHEEADKVTFTQAQETVKNNPDSYAKQYILGLVCLNLHKDKAAGEVFKRLILLEPKRVETRWGQAELLRRQHKLDESEQILRNIIKENSRFSPAYISLAYLRYTKLDFKDAAKIAAKVIVQGRNSVDPTNLTRAYLIYAGTKGMLAHYGGPFAKAFHGPAIMSNIKKAKKLQPDSPEVLFGLGSFYFLAPGILGGNLDKAEDYLKRTVKADPLFADAYVRLAQVYQAKGNKELYDNYINVALEIDSGNELAVDIESRKCKFICVANQK